MSTYVKFYQQTYGNGLTIVCDFTALYTGLGRQTLPFIVRTKTSFQCPCSEGSGSIRLDLRYERIAVARGSYVSIFKPWDGLFRVSKSLSLYKPANLC